MKIRGWLLQKMINLIKEVAKLNYDVVHLEQGVIYIGVLMI